MKKVIIKLLVISIALLGILGFSGCKQEDISQFGVVAISVIDEINYEPVANADVNIYLNVDDMAFEQYSIGRWQTDNNGNLILNDLPRGEYYLDVVKGALNNWNNQFYGPLFVENGQINWTSVYISRNIYGLLSSPEGKSWTVTSIANDVGQDLTSDPNYSCLLDNTYYFQKSGFFSLDEGNNLCNSSTPIISEGSWSGWGVEFFSLGFGEFGPELQYYVTEFSDTHLVVDGDTELGWLTLRLDLIN